MVYRRNKYNWFVMNKNVKGKQCTILWHAKNLNMLPVGSDIVSSIISDIDAEYVNISKMANTRGKIHKYIWMTIDSTPHQSKKYSLWSIKLERFSMKS